MNGKCCLQFAAEWTCQRRRSMVWWRCSLCCQSCHANIDKSDNSQIFLNSSAAAEEREKYLRDEFLLEESLYVPLMIASSISCLFFNSSSPSLWKQKSCVRINSWIYSDIRGVVDKGPDKVCWTLNIKKFRVAKMCLSFILSTICCTV